MRERQTEREKGERHTETNEMWNCGEAVLPFSFFLASFIISCMKVKIQWSSEARTGWASGHSGRAIEMHLLNIDDLRHRENISFVWLEQQHLGESGKGLLKKRAFHRFPLLCHYWINCLRSERGDDAGNGAVDVLNSSFVWWKCHCKHTSRCSRPTLPELEVGCFRSFKERF